MRIILLRVNSTTRIASSTPPPNSPRSPSSRCSWCSRGYGENPHVGLRGVGGSGMMAGETNRREGERDGDPSR